MRARLAVLQSGYTLVELMVTVIVVSLLSAVAVPYYQDYMAKTRMAGMQRFALSLTLEQEAFYRENGRFLGADTAERRTVSVEGDGYDKYHFWRRADGSGLVVVVATADLYPGAEAGGTFLYQGIADAFGNVSWECVQHANADRRLDAEYVPSDCQEIVSDS